MFLRDYLQLVKARANTVWEAQVTKDEWVALLAGRPSSLVDGVHDPDDPEPSYDVLWGELTGGSRLQLRLLTRARQAARRPRERGSVDGRAGPRRRVGRRQSARAAPTATRAATVRATTATEASRGHRGGPAHLRRGEPWDGRRTRTAVPRYLTVEHDVAPCTPARPPAR